MDKAWRHVDNLKKTIWSTFQNGNSTEESVSEILQKDLPLSGWNLQLGRFDDLPFYENLDEFVTVDDDVVTSELKTDLGIVWEVQETEEAFSDDEEGKEIDEVVSPSEIKDPQQAIKVVFMFHDSQITYTTIFKFI